SRPAYKRSYLRFSAAVCGGSSVKPIAGTFPGEAGPPTMGGSSVAVLPTGWTRHDARKPDVPHSPGFRRREWLHDEYRWLAERPVEERTGRNGPPQGGQRLRRHE